MAHLYRNIVPSIPGLAILKRQPKVKWEHHIILFHTTWRDAYWRHIRIAPFRGLQRTQLLQSIHFYYYRFKRKNNKFKWCHQRLRSF